MKETKNIKAKKLMLAIIIIVLFIPLIQNNLNLFKLKELSGSFEKTENIDFSINKWFHGNYSTTKQDYLNQNIGFRNTLVRTYNQLYFSLYNEARAVGIAIGIDDFLYEYYYIDALNGDDFVGVDTVENKVFKLHKVCDTLKTKGIDLVVVLAPGKASFYPEYIPKNLVNANVENTNFDEYEQQLSQTNINVLNFRKWFAQMKDTSSYPLFPKTGIHWSKYGEILVIDSLIKSFADIRPQNKMPKFNITGMEFSTDVRATDDDIEKSMNLFFDIPDLKMAYPNYEIISDSSTNPPKVLTVADSYYWGMYSDGFSTKLFSNGEFWYYNKQVFQSKHKTVNVSDINVRQRVEENDIIMILLTDANLYRFAFGFIDNLYEIYFEPEKYNNKLMRKAKLLEKIKAIKADEKWLESVSQKAKEKGISLDEALELDAKYILSQESEK